MVPDVLEVWFENPSGEGSSAMSAKQEKTFQSPYLLIQVMYMRISFEVAWRLLFHTEMPESATCKPLLDERYRAHSDSLGDCDNACQKNATVNKSSKSASCRSHIFVVNVYTYIQLVGGTV